jgi:hypothetical protein
MSHDARAAGYWREEFSLIAVLLLFFAGIVAFAFKSPFDARLFPVVIGTAGILLTLGIAVGQVRRYRSGAPAVRDDDPAAKVAWPRFATALTSAPVFGLLFWLFGFVVASLAAMLLMPVLMGYRNRRRLVIIALVTVALLALVFPYLLNVALPHGLIGDWLIDRFALRAG